MRALILCRLGDEGEQREDRRGGGGPASGLHISSGAADEQVTEDVQKRRSDAGGRGIATGALGREDGLRGGGGGRGGGDGGGVENKDEAA